MAKTGSIESRIKTAAFDIHIGRIVHNTKRLEAKGLELFNDGMSEAFKAFRDAKATNNKQIIIEAETVFTYQEYCFCNKNNKQAAASLAQGFKDMLDVVEELSVADEELKISNIIISSKNKNRVRGYPMDAFHEGCTSQIWRLNNSLRSNAISPAELELTNQRIDNLKRAKELHLEKQASLMPKRSRGKEIGE